MFFLILTLMVPIASELIDCEAACDNCKDQSGDTAIIEVYCSMCEECKDRKGHKDAPDASGGENHRRDYHKKGDQRWLDQRNEDSRREDYRVKNYRLEGHNREEQSKEERRREEQRREEQRREEQKREEQRREEQRREEQRREEQRREEQRREDRRKEEKRMEDQRREDYRGKDHRKEDQIEYLPDKVKFDTYSFITRPTFNVYKSILNQFATSRTIDLFEHRDIPRNRVAHPTRTYFESDSDFLEVHTKRHLRQEDDYPKGCPTPPECSEDDEDDYGDDQPQLQPQMHPDTTTPTTTTQTTTRTTTARTCPPIPNCKKRNNRDKKRDRKKTTPNYVPVPIPMFPFPCPPCYGAPFPYIPSGNNLQNGNLSWSNNPWSLPGYNIGPHLNGSSMIPDNGGVVTPNVPPEIHTEPSSSSTIDYIYMYVGLPKNVMIKP